MCHPEVLWQRGQHAGRGRVWAWKRQHKAIVNGEEPRWICGHVGEAGQCLASHLSSSTIQAWMRCSPNSIAWNLLCFLLHGVYRVFTMIAEVLGDGKGVQWPISPAIPGEQKISDQFARRFYQFGDIYLISCLLDLLGMIGSRRQYICLIVGSPEPEAWFNICPIESTICLANELYFCCCWYNTFEQVWRLQQV